MLSIDTNDPAAKVVDRLWRAYAPYQRGRSTDRDLTAMLAVLVLARFVDSVRDPGDEMVKRWSRAVAEARTGYPPLRDLHDALSLAYKHERLPALAPWNSPNVFAGTGGADDLPWTAAFLTALQQTPTALKAGLTEVSDLLQERYVTESSARTGEYYTPRAVTRLLAEVLSPRPGDRVLDPACGTGGLLTAAADHIAQQSHGGASFEGYAMDHRNPQLAMLNLALHGVDRPLVQASDPGSLFRNPGSAMAEFVLCNPPFNQRVQNLERLYWWPFGPPPESNANFAWLQFAWTRLSEKGKAAVIMPAGAASARDRSARIRQGMLAGGALLAVVALPADLFSHTNVPVHLWLLARDASRHFPAGETGSVLFVDASRLATQTPHGAHAISPADRDRISGRFHAWLRSPRETLDEPGFSCSVSYDEILENEGCSFDPRMHVAPVREQLATALNTRRLLDELVKQAESTADSTAALCKSFDWSERVVRGEPVAPRERLRSVVKGPAEGTLEAPGLLLAGPSGTLIRADQYLDVGGVPVVMPRDLKGSDFSTENVRRISEEQAQRLERFHLRPGDVVLARRGELGRAAVVREEQNGWVCGTGCFLLRPPAGLDADYFVAYLRGPEARTWLEAHSTGSMKMRTISLDVIGDLPIALPDLATQQTIADTIKRLDEHECQLREQLALTQRIRHDALDGGIIPTP